MRTAVLIILLAGTANVLAIPTSNIDLGPSRLVKADSTDFVGGSATQMGLDGTPLDGQTISFNVAFINGHFVRAFTATTFLRIVFRLPLNGVAPLPEDIVAGGSGYFIDQNGNSVGQPTPLSLSFESFHAPPFTADDVVIFGLLGPNTPRPVDLYGFHFDFMLDLPGGAIDEDGPFSRFESVEFNHFRAIGIGPNIPSDFVPDGGCTLSLLGIAAVALVAFTRLRMVDSCPGR